MAANEVAPNLFVGSHPTKGGMLARKGIRVLCLCAQELQPNGVDYRNLDLIIRCPIDDADVSPKELAAVKEASKHVARAVRQGKPTLCSCHMGLNRSAFVAACALIRLNVKPTEAIRRIRAARGQDALSNSSFERAILHFRPGLH